MPRSKDIAEAMLNMIDEIAEELGFEGRVMVCPGKRPGAKGYKCYPRYYRQVPAELIKKHERTRKRLVKGVSGLEDLGAEYEEVPYTEYYVAVAPRSFATKPGKKSQKEKFKKAAELCKKAYPKIKATKNGAALCFHHCVKYALRHNITDEKDIAELYSKKAINEMKSYQEEDKCYCKRE